MECFSVIREEREGLSDEDDRVASRPTEDLLKSDLLHPSSPATKRDAPSSAHLRPAKKPRPSSPPARAKPAKPVKQPRYDSDEDAKFAAELDQVLNSTPVRKTRGAASGATRKPRPKKTKKDDDGETTKKKRAPNPNNAFHAPMLLSPQLTDVVFETELPRTVKYVKLFS